MSNQNEKILCVSAHPDDEVGGAGGFLIKREKQGTKIHLILLTDGSDDRQGQSAEGKIRVNEFKQVAKILNAESVFLNFPRYFPLDLSKTILPLVREIRKFRPTCVMAPWDGERHPEHTLTNAVALEAIRVARKNKYLDLGQPIVVGEFREFELDDTFSRFNAIEDITEVIDEKEKLFSAYQSQATNKDYIAAFRGLNQFRGITFRTGRFAEAFRVRHVT